MKKDLSKNPILPKSKQNRTHPDLRMVKKIDAKVFEEKQKRKFV